METGNYDKHDVELIFADIQSMLNILELTAKNCACLENFSSIDSQYLLSIIRITKNKLMLLEKVHRQGAVPEQLPR